MALEREKDGKRLHIKSRLMGESLVGHTFLDSLENMDQVRLFPDVLIFKIGGQSICDRGKAALPPIVREIGENSKKRKILITTGGGTRSRHIYNIGIELGMPTGIIARFGTMVSEQNALLVSVLLAKWGGIKIGEDELVKLAQYFNLGSIPVIHGMPPYDLFALPPDRGRIPVHRTDVGTMVLADLLGIERVIFIKDEKGLYTDDPKKNPDAEFIPHISATELKQRDFDDLIIERPCLDILQNSTVVNKIQVINGLEPVNIARVMNGEDVGTIITG
jgi:molybdenum storage protein